MCVLLLGVAVFTVPLLFQASDLKRHENNMHNERKQMNPLQSDAETLQAAAMAAEEQHMDIGSAPWHMLNTSATSWHQNNISSGHWHLGDVICSFFSLLLLWQHFFSSSKTGSDQNQSCDTHGSDQDSRHCFLSWYRHGSDEKQDG